MSDKPRFDHSTNGGPEPLPGRCGRKIAKSDPPRYCKRKATGPYVDGPCKFHGGRSPNLLKKHEEQRETIAAAKAATRIGILVDVAPHDAILDELARSAGMVAYYHARLTEATGDQHGKLILEQGEATKWLGRWNTERDRLTKVAATAAQLGIAQQRIDFQQAQGQRLVDGIRAAIDDPTVALTAQQRAAVLARLPHTLAVLTGGTPPDDGGGDVIEGTVL